MILRSKVINLNFFTKNIDYCMEYSTRIRVMLFVANYGKHVQWACTMHTNKYLSKCWNLASREKYCDGSGLKSNLPESYCKLSMALMSKMF